MIDITNELKTKLLAAKSAEEVAELVKADGQELTQEDAAHLWEEISRKREQEGRELSLDELEAVSGGKVLDGITDGCAATVEPGSWCDSNDWCWFFDVEYWNEPISEKCPHCGIWLYQFSDVEDYVVYREKDYYRRCKQCGYTLKQEKVGKWVQVSP